MFFRQLSAGFFLALLLPVGSIAQPSTTVPIEKVVFFKSGVSYVEHRGQVQGTETMTLRFSNEQMKDVLKSLVVQDQGGGQIGTISYPSQDPLRRILEGFPITDDPEGFGTLINNVRGTDLQLVTPGGSVQGTAVSAERRDGANGAERWFLNLYSEGTLRSVPLDSVQALRFENPDLQEQMRKALDAVAQARDTGSKPVQLRFEGTGSRRVRLGYVVKAPVWKTSYRLLLPDENEGEGQIQGWAIVENQTDADWSGVDLRLVSGRPVSFVQDLYTPTYVDRPVVSPTTGQPLSPTLYEEGIDAPQKSSVEPEEEGVSMDYDARGRTARSSAAQLEAAQAPAPNMDPTQGVSSAATAAEAGAFFQYQVSDVSLDRRQSAMLPIVTEALQVERLSIYDPSLHERHPLQGARVENTTGRHLAAGPLTVFDEGSYAGDARLSDTPPGDTRYVSYALNQDVQIDRNDGGTEETVETGKIVNGVLEMARRRVASQTYTIENDGTRDVTLIVEHPRRDGWSLVEPDAEERTASAYRFRTTVDEGDTETLTVEQERMLTERYQLASANRDRLLIYARTGALPGDVRDALEQAADLQQALAQTETELQRAEQQLQRYRDAQSRIRENLKAIEANTEYHQRLLDKLKTQEDEIEALMDRIASLESTKAAQQDRLDSYLQDLDVQ